MQQNYEHKVISQNKKARHDYFILETKEAGIALFGTEIKSVRNGNVNLKDSYCEIRNGEMFIVGMHISPYEKGNIFNKDPYRDKKLLLHKKEILKYKIQVSKEGLTVVPLSLYFSKRHVKVELALCKGKKAFDKRQTLKEKEDRREMDRAMKVYK